MKTLFLCFCLLVGILGVVWIFHSPPPGSMRDTDRISLGTVKKAVEKALNEPEFFANDGGRVDKVVIKEIRKSDDGNRFKIYFEYRLKDKLVSQGEDTLRRDEFGVWRFESLYQAKLDLREQQ